MLEHNNFWDPPREAKLHKKLIITYHYFVRESFKKGPRITKIYNASCNMKIG